MLEKGSFLRVAGVPNVLGAVDGTLIPIMAPRNREDTYICMKGYHAIHVQACVDSDMRYHSSLTVSHYLYVI